MADKLNVPQPNPAEPELKIEFEYLWFASTRLSATQVGGSIVFVTYSYKFCANKM